jgi:hypothetical protein
MKTKAKKTEIKKTSEATRQRVEKMITLKLFKNLGQAVALIEEASSLLDYEDEKNPTYGIKYRCEKFVKKMLKEWQKK